MRIEGPARYLHRCGGFVSGILNGSLPPAVTPPPGGRGINDEPNDVSREMEPAPPPGFPSLRGTKAKVNGMQVF
jgi:hypothetical protein